MTRLVFLAIGLAFFIYLVVQLGPGAVIEMLGRIRWEGLWIAGIYAAYQSARAIALSASVLGSPSLPFRDALWIRLAGEAVQFLTFTGPFLAEPAKAWLLAGRTRSAVHGFAATLTEYLTYMFTAAVLSSAALAWLLSAGMLTGAARTTAIVLVVIMILFLATSAWAIAARVHLLGAILERIASLPGIRRKLRPDMASVHRTEDLLLGILHDRPARFAWIAILEATAHLLHVLELLAILRALSLPARFVTAFLIEGATKFVGLAFFFIPGQIGASEGAHTLVFEVVGLPAVAGFTVPFVRRIRSAGVAGLGLLALSLMTRRK
jgi:hypothetical protein